MRSRRKGSGSPRSPRRRLGWPRPARPRPRQSRRARLRSARSRALPAAMAERLLPQGRPACPDRFDDAAKCDRRTDQGERLQPLRRLQPGPNHRHAVPGLDLRRSGAAPVTNMARSLRPRQPIVVIDAKTLKRQLIWSELERDTREPREGTLNQSRRRLARRAPLHRRAAQPPAQLRFLAPNGQLVDTCGPTSCYADCWTGP